MIVYSLYAQWKQNIQSAMSNNRHERLLYIRQRSRSTDELYTIPRDPVSYMHIHSRSDKRSSYQVEMDSLRQANMNHKEMDQEHSHTHSNQWEGKSHNHTH